MTKRQQALDVLIAGGGTVYLVVATSPRSDAWVDDYLPDDGPHLGRNSVVEHRFIREIVRGMVKDGLMVERA